MRLLLVVSLLLACTPETDDSDDAGISTSGSTTAAPTTGEPTTGGGACQDPAGSDFGPAVAFAIRNDGDAPLFLVVQSFCADVLPVALFAGADEIQISPGQCDFACADAMSGNCGCPLGCGDPSDVLQIAPGGVYTDTWSGVRVAPFELDATCVVNDCSPTCTAQVQTPPGDYTLRATAAAAVGNCDTCDCTPNDDGWCTFEADLDGPTVVAEAALDYPAQTAAELVFD